MEGVQQGIRSKELPSTRYRPTTSESGEATYVIVVGVVGNHFWGQVVERTAEGLTSLFRVDGPTEIC